MMRRTRIRPLAVVVLLLALVLTGCGSSPKGITGPAAAKLPGSGMVLLVAGPFHASDMGDPMEGKPQIVNDRCLGFLSGDQVYVAVWPSGPTVGSPDDDRITVNGHEVT